MKPFLKWAGNKQKILDHIKGELPAGRRLLEPFVGSGAVFLNTEYHRYLLSDSNADLINLYVTLQQEGAGFIAYARSFFQPRHNREDAYYRLRRRFNTARDLRLKSALFLYLNRHGYNGLCRYNASGEFNVPFGRYSRPYFPQRELEFFHAKAQRAVFRHGDFEDTMRRARRGDVVYCDPPYVPLTASANFTAFSPGGFDMRQQVRLAELAARLARRGVPVLVSNHDTPFTQDRYSSARIRRFDVRRFISCNGANRAKVGELLALFS